MAYLSILAGPFLLLISSLADKPKYSKTQPLNKQIRVIVKLTQIQRSHMKCTVQIGPASKKNTAPPVTNWKKMMILYIFYHVSNEALFDWR